MGDHNQLGKIDPITATLSEMMFPEGPGITEEKVNGKGVWTGRSDLRQLTPHDEWKFEGVINCFGIVGFALRRWETSSGQDVGVVLSMMARMQSSTNRAKYERAWEFVLEPRLHLKFPETAGFIELRWTGHKDKNLDKRVPLKDLATSGSSGPSLVADKFETPEAPNGEDFIHPIDYSPTFLDRTAHPVFSAWYFHEGPAPGVLPWACAKLAEQKFEVEWFQAETGP